MAANRLPTKVVQLRDKAREHKKQEGRERRAARLTMAELEDLCSLMGVDFREVSNGKVESDKVNDPSSA